MSELKEKLKAQIIEQLNLDHLTVAEFKDEALLFSDEGLGLDSIDALEFIVLLDSHYGIKIDDPAGARAVFHSINSLAAFIESKVK